MKIALTGGIACGKSTFAKFLLELGIRVIDADDIVHELEAPGGGAVPAIASRFGNGVLAPDGGIDRAKLADVVFLRGQTPIQRGTDPNSAGDSPQFSGGQSPREALEEILFPLVRSRLRAFADATPAGVISVAIIPLLFESHFDEDYDIIIAIASSEDLQIDRMMRTRGYSRAQAEARLAAQMPVAEKAVRAHFVVVNNSTPENLKNEAMRLVAWLQEKAKHEHRGFG